MFDSITKFPSELLLATVVAYINERWSKTRQKLSRIFIITDNIEFMKMNLYSIPIFAAFISIGIINQVIIIKAAY